MGIWIGDMRFSSVWSVNEYFAKERRYRGVIGKFRKLYDYMFVKKGPVVSHTPHAKRIGIKRG